MRLLVDTHLLIWALTAPARLPPVLRERMENPETVLFASVVSIWEVAIKFALERADFRLDAATFRHGLALDGFAELAVTGEHALKVAALPRLHGDPFDRLLIAQALAEGLTLATSDRALARYPVPLFSA